MSSEHANRSESGSAYVNEYVDIAVSPADPSIQDIQSIRLHYRVNRTDIDREYMSNASALDNMDRLISGGLIGEEDYIVVTGKSSPEGPLAGNKRLAEQRALSFKNYILQTYPHMRSNQIITTSEGESWGGLVKMIEADSRVPFREELLGILNDSLSRETQKVRIRSLAGGEPYKYLLKNILPYLREGTTGIFYIRKEAPTISAIP